MSHLYPSWIVEELFLSPSDQKTKKRTIKTRNLSRPKKCFNEIENQIIHLMNQVQSFSNLCKCNPILGSSFQLQQCLSDEIHSFLIQILGISSNLVLIIEEYCETYEYFLKPDDPWINMKIPKTIMTEICNLFLIFIQIQYLEDQKYGQYGNQEGSYIHDKKINYILEFRTEKDYCFQGISVYRVVVGKNEILNLLENWKNWKGQTKHSICECSFRKQTKQTLLHMIETGGGIFYADVQSFSKNVSFFNPFCRLIDILSNLFQVMKKRKSNLRITFYPDI